MTLVLRDVEVAGRRTAVAIHGDTIVAVGDGAGSRPDSGPVEVVDGAGGALLPGLWDHHVHLLATAAAMRSVVVGPPDVRTPSELRRALAAAAAASDTESAAGGWIRAVAYHESVAGNLDRTDLDAVVGHRPVRVQHRSGAQWTLNSVAVDALGLDHDRSQHPGVERDADGRATGRVIGADDWLRERLADDPPDLSDLGARLTALGVVGVTDATPYADTDAWTLLADAARRGHLPQHLVVTGGPALTSTPPPDPLVAGPVKLYLADHSLPALDDIAGWISTAHDADRKVAFHSVTRASLALAVAALDAVGAEPGDRIEHGAVVPPDLADAVARLGTTVVTQPSFVAERGDEYLTDVDPDDRDHLYPCAGLLARGVPVSASTDAPFGTLDPWASIVAAASRRTASGKTIGGDEAIGTRRTLAMFLTSHDDPGGEPRRVAPRQRADLCLLDRPLDEQLEAPTADAVRATIIAGRLHGRRQLNDHSWP